MNYVGTHIDLFSGIGGFTIAAEQSGWKTIAFSEVNPYACSILKKHWPHIPNFGDIRTFPTIHCDLITGGFPCQPFSCSGKQRSTSDNRNLWPAMLDVIRRCQPTWIIGENVANIQNLALHSCLNDLENSGYFAKSLSIPACAAGLSTLERHIWIVASRHGLRLERYTQESLQKQSLQISEWRKIDSNSSFQPLRPNLSSPQLCRIPQRIPSYMDRIKCIGNSIPPQIAQIILSHMACIHSMCHNSH